MTDRPIIAIQTANLLSARVRRKCQQLTVTSTTTRNSDMATKTGNTYTTGTTTDSFKIPTQVSYFWQWKVQIKCPQVIMTMSDNRKWSTPEPEVLISLELWQIGRQFQRQLWGFRACQVRRNWPRAISTRTDNRKWQYRDIGPESAIFGSRSLSKSFGYTLIKLGIIENPEFVVRISMLSIIVPEI